jgi:uncharacterized membrane protein
VVAAGLALRDRWLLISAALSAIPVMIFFMHMNVPAAEFKLTEERSDALEFLLYAFTPIAAAYVFTGKRYMLLSLPLSIPLYFLSPVLAFTTPLLITSLHGLYKKDPTSAVILSGVAAFILPEFFAVESRLNTVFKFYIFAWIALMVASTASMEWQSRRKHFLAVLLIIGVIYPLAATPVRYGTAELSLDGMSFMKAYDGDYYAVKWLQDKKGIIIEEGCTHGALCGYQYGGRVVAFTGNPAVIAWTNHEFAWRRNYTLVAERAKDVRDFYTASSCERMKEIAEKYGVEYVFYGYEEKRIFSASPEKFEKCFDKVFEFGGTYIFATKNLS